MTLAEAMDIAASLSFSWRSESGSTITEAQMIKLLTLASADITRTLKNNIVMSSYLKEIRGNDTTGVKLSPSPIIDFDEPRIRRKDVSDNFNLPSWGKWVYFINHASGELCYRRDEFLVDSQSPFSRDNLVYVGFIAGHYTIPEEIKKAVVEMSRYLLQPRQMDIQELAGGSGRIKFGDKIPAIKRIYLALKGFKAR